MILKIENILRKRRNYCEADNNSQNFLNISKK